MIINIISLILILVILFIIMYQYNEGFIIRGSRSARAQNKITTPFKLFK